MFSQNTTEFYCNEPTMNNSNDHCWSYSQDVQPTKYQLSPELGATNDYMNHVNQSSWSPEFTNCEFQQNVYESPQFHGLPAQYTPLSPEPVSRPVCYLPQPYQNPNLMARRHRAQISFVPTKTGNFKAIVKRKRKRTAFTTEQIEALEGIFKKKQYITREDRQVIVNQLQLADKAVKIWFQNRRLKDKKELNQAEEENENELLAERTLPSIARLDYVESQINEKTDEFGYVTLDDGVMNNLLGVIDDFLINKEPSYSGEHSDNSPVYEPISPASPSDSSNDENGANSWKPSQPDESLQRLFDLQTMLAL